MRVRHCHELRIWLELIDGQVGAASPVEEWVAWGNSDLSKRGGEPSHRLIGRAVYRSDPSASELLSVVVK